MKTNEEIIAEVKKDQEDIWTEWKKTKDNKIYKKWAEFGSKRDKVLLTEARKSERADMLKELEDWFDTETHKFQNGTDRKLLEWLKIILVDKLKNKIGAGRANFGNASGERKAVQIPDSPTKTKRATWEFNYDALKINNEDVLEFLAESNNIEREYSKESLADAILAWKYAMSQPKINMDMILKTHKILMERKQPELAGVIRDYPIWIGGKKKNQKRNEIIKELKIWIQLCKLIKNENDIKNCHISFEEIHPFGDGNGRIGRILLNIQRINLNLPILIIHTGKEQMGYYKWFKTGVK